MIKLCNIMFVHGFWLLSHLDTQVPKKIGNSISKFAILSKYHCYELNKHSEEKIGEIDATLILIKLKKWFWYQCIQIVLLFFVI